MFDELGLVEFDNPSNVLGSFVSVEVGGEFNELPAIILRDCNLFIEDELIKIVGRDVVGDGYILVLDGHFAGELDFHFDGLDAESKRINIDFLFCHVQICE